jgi:hypothetical protein
MAELGEILRQQLAGEVGRDITISQKNGVEITGKLIEVDFAYVTIKRTNGRKTILLDLIGAWEILDNEFSQAANETAHNVDAMPNVV